MAKKKLRRDRIGTNLGKFALIRAHRYKKVGQETYLIILYSGVGEQLGGSVDTSHNGLAVFLDYGGSLRLEAEDILCDPSAADRSFPGSAVQWKTFRVMRHWSGAKFLKWLEDEEYKVG